MRTIHWANTAFLFTTFFTTLFCVPLYLWCFGFAPLQAILFLLFFVATGLSITLGYHRLFSHLTFQASLPVRLFTLVFGAAAFEGSALQWCADHRRHHKHAGHDADPYDIRRGFWHAHIGWMLFREGPDTPLTWVRDLQKDRLVLWQHRHVLLIGFLAGFALPAAIGWACGGWPAALGAFLIAGVARVVFVHHMTFCINSLCHWTGRRPYSSESSARDSFLMALFTFGEGYHNYHHEFQHDYRNGVKPWQFDPTKWTIRTLHCLGLARNLRSVPRAKILQAEIAEQNRRLARVIEARPAAGAMSEILNAAQFLVEQTFERWSKLQEEYQLYHRTRTPLCKARRTAAKSELRNARLALGAALNQWRTTSGTIFTAI